MGEDGVQLNSYRSIKLYGKGVLKNFKATNNPIHLTKTT